MSRSAKTGRMRRVDEFTRQVFQNATGYFLLARHLRNHVVARGSEGAIVLLGSMCMALSARIRPFMKIFRPPAPRTRGGASFTSLATWRSRGLPDRVRVNCLSPGPFPSARAPEELCQRLSARSPMGRMGRPEELKGAIVFLSFASLKLRRRPQPAHRRRLDGLVDCRRRPA